MWGSPTVGDPFAAAFTGRHPAGPRRHRRGRARGGGRPIAAPDRRGRPAAAPGHRPAPARPGPARGGAGRAGRRRRSLRHRQPGLGALARPGGPRAGRARPRRRGAGAGRRAGRAAAPVGCAVRAGRGAAAGRRAARRRTGVPLLREAVDLLAPTGAALELARARLALGRRPEVDADEAVPLLRAAAAGGRDCGARPVLDAAVAALADRGERPDRTIRRRPRG